MQILSVPNKMRNSSSFTSIHWKASPHSALRVFIISISIQDRRPRDHMMMLVPLELRGKDVGQVRSGQVVGWTVVSFTSTFTLCLSVLCVCVASPAVGR